MTEPRVVLSVDSLSKRFGRITALKSVSFALAEGDFLAVFGRNGAGKSTLLNIIATLIRSYDGSVTMFGKNLRKSDRTTRRLLGYISHDSYLYGDLTAFENLYFYARLYGVREPRSAATAMLERLRLETKSGAAARDLSRGMKQRLSLGRSFLHEPRILLLDEPYTGLDETACKTLNDMLSEYVAGGGSVLMTTHDIDRAFSTSTRVSILERGNITYEVKTAKTNAAAFRETYQNILAL